jgi:hypothetical protein
MAETLGSLIDKLTIVKLKQWHSEDEKKLESLSFQEKQLQEEINYFVEAGLAGEIPFEHLVFKSNKVYKKSKFDPKSDLNNSLGQKIAGLAEINCKLWHEQEKVYDFENVPVSEKDNVINNLAVFNLERTNYIDEIDQNFQLKVKEKLSLKE